jgi:transposase
MKLLEKPEIIFDLYINQKLTRKQIAEKYNTSISSVDRFLQKHNILKDNRTTQNLSEVEDEVKEFISKNYTNDFICKKLNIPLSQLLRYKGEGKYSNKLEDESWIDINNPIFWYILGIISSDGHFGEYNEICIFQKDPLYLKLLQSLIHHKGTLYKCNDSYTLKITSKKLHIILEKCGMEHDKRYSVKMPIAPNNSLQMMYIRGLFDGDGCFYFNYVSGKLKNKHIEICTGSEYMKNSLEKFYKKLGFNPKISNRKAVNDYYVISLEKEDEMIKFGELLYKENLNIMLKRKYLIYLKFLKIIEINKEIDDIVDLL